MHNKVLKYMFGFLIMVVLITVIFGQGCSSTPSKPAAPATPSQTSTSPQTPQVQDGASSSLPDFMKKILASVATKLGIAEDKLTQAYEAARETTVPPSPPGGAPTNSPENDASQGKISDFMAPIFDKMSVSLGISADKISTAWQAAMKELQPAK
jgi:hypothetical protein